jgi:hypothetical protein
VSKLPDAITFKVDAYYKLAKGETGLTNASTYRCAAAEALDFVVSHLPDGVTVEYLGDDGKPIPGDDAESDVVRLTIDWTKVPDAVRSPVLPARRR